MKRPILSAALATTLLGGCAISTQQEVQMGQSYAAQINQQLPIVQDAEVNRYINTLGRQIASKTKRADLDWRFFVVNSPEVNAFAVPGGFIYINRGLIERADNLAEFAGVLGHEIGHVTERHTVQQMQKAQGAEVGVTLACVLTSVCNNQASQAAINVGGSAVFAKFSRDAEREADEKAVEFMVRMGINPSGITTMFQELMAERKSRPGGVEAWFATHPLEEERISRTQSMVAKLPANQRNGTTDSQAYQSFRRRVASLPAAAVARTR